MLKPKETKNIEPENKSQPAPTYYHAVGRRKEATARVRLYVVPGKSLVLGDKTYTKGQIIVNDRSIETYFPGVVTKVKFLESFRTTNTLERFVTTVVVVGGGLAGQLEAVVHGVARALEQVDREKYRPILKKRGFLTRDPRAKQRRKAGFAGKARKKKQSPKR